MKRRTIVQTSLAAGLMAGMVALGLSEDEPAASLGKDDAMAADRLVVPARRVAGRRAWRRGTLEVYVRPKLGFCGNCDTGVVTDEEVDRVTDVDLLDERFEPAKEGLAVRIGALSGRARLYRYKLIGGGTRHAEGIAVSQKVRPRHCRDRRQPFRRARTHRGLSASRVRAWCRTGSARNSADVKRLMTFWTARVSRALLNALRRARSGKLNRY